MDRVDYESLGRAWSPRSLDDRLDALAMALAYWVESMSKDFEEAKERALDSQLERFMNPRRFQSVVIPRIS